MYIYICMLITGRSNFPIIHFSFSVNHNTFLKCISQISFYVYIAYTKSFYKLYSNFYSNK